MRRTILAVLTTLLSAAAWSGRAHAQTLFFDNFENGGSAWSLPGVWHMDSSATSCGQLLSPFPSGTHCLRMGNPTGPGCSFHVAYSPPTAQYHYATLTTPIALVGTGATAWLRYMNRIDTEGCALDQTGGFKSFDASIREVSIDAGASWIPLQYDCSGSRWHKGRADLSPYMGQQILIRFSFWAGDALQNDGFGWLIDDVAIRIEPGTPHCDATNACPCGNYHSTYWNEDPKTANIGGCVTSWDRQAELYAMGHASMTQDDVVLYANNLPAGSTALFVQGSALTAPTPFEDGTTCIGGQIIRLGLRSTANGSISHAGPGSFPLSAAATANATFAYQVYFRNSASYCTPGTLNLTNAYTIHWQP